MRSSASWKLGSLILTVIAFCAVSRCAVAGVPMWGTVPTQPSGDYTFFADPHAACQYQHDYWSPFSSFYGATPYPGSFRDYKCQWSKVIGYSDPSLVHLVCTDGNGHSIYTEKLVPPGTCVPTAEPTTARPACSYNDGATPNPTAGDPVLLSNGSLYERHVDYEDADRRLTISRTYRSKTAANLVSYFPYARPFGAGDLWKMSWQWEIALDPGYFPSTGGIVVSGPDGSQYGFRLASNGTISREEAGVNDLALTYVNPGGSVNYSGILTNGGQFQVATRSGDQILMGLFIPYWAANWPASQRYIVGRPLQIVFRGGYTWSFAYGSQGELQTITDNLGRQISLGWYYSAVFGGSTTYPRAIQSISLPDGTTLTYGYDSLGGTQGGNDGFSRLKTFTRTKSGATADSATYHYTDAGSPVLLTGAIDNAGVQWQTWQYDSNGRVISASHPSGADAISIAYSAGYYSWDAIRTVTNALGHVDTYKFYAPSSGEARLVSVVGTATTNCVGTTRSWTYDTSNRKTTTVDARGTTTQYTYGTDGRVATMTEGLGTPAQRATQYTWNNTFGVPTQIVRPGRTLNLTYDSAGRLTQRQAVDTTTQSVPYSTNSQSRTWSYSYNTAGLLAQEVGPLSGGTDVTLYGYSAYGYRSSVTDALSHVTQVTSLDGAGRPITILDQNGVQTTLTYDGAGRLTSRATSGETATYSYWPAGLLKQVTFADSSYVLYTYDTARRLTRIDDAAGNHILYTLDAMGNRTAEDVYDPSGSLTRTHTSIFDALGRLYKDIRAAGTAAVTTTHNYDGNNNLTTTTAPLSRVTTRTYDALNRLTGATDPASGVTTLTYDARGNVLSVVDPRSLMTAYVYDGFDAPIQISSPDTGTSVDVFDSAGDLSTHTDARSKTGTYTHDVLHRVTSISHPDRTTSFTYDSGTNGVGRLTGASDANHSLGFSYDAKGRVTTKSQTVGAIAKSVSYGYTNGNRTSLTTPSGQVITYGFTSGRVTSVVLNGSTTILDQVLYEPFGPVSGWRWGNGTFAARVYDADGLPTMIDSAGAVSFTTDDAGRITAITDLVNSSLSWSSLGHDSLDRLVSAVKSGQTIGYTYDANGNRLTQTGSQPATYSVSSTNNRISSITGTPARTYTYDAAGHTTGDGTRTWTYTDAGRLSSVTQGGVTTAYIYNALGQRVKKSNASMTRHFMYDEAGHLIGEYDASGALVEETVWLDDIPVATLRPNNGGVSVYYVHTDHLNTPRRITRPSDNVIVWRWDSDPFGNAAADEDPDGDSIALPYGLRFAGQYFDPESGSHYNYARDYDAAVGRYLQSDPIGLRGGINTYAYVRSNPLRFIDPFGLQEAPTNSNTPTGPSNTPTVPDDETGAGKKAQEAEDNEGDRKGAEQRAAEKCAEGDQAGADREKNRALDALRRYHDSIGQPWNPNNTRGNTQEEHDALVKKQIEDGESNGTPPPPAKPGE